MQQASLLLVDDDLDGLKSTAAYLAGKNFRVLQAIDDKDMLQHCIREIPEIIILNANIAGLDLEKIFSQIRMELVLRDTYICISLAGGKGSPANLSVLASGADDFLVRPISKKTLLLRILGMVKKRKDKIDLRQRETALEQKNSEMAAYQELGLQMSKSPGMDVLLSVISRTVLSITFADEVFISLYEGSRLVMKESSAAAGIPDRLSQAGACHFDCISERLKSEPKVLSVIKPGISPFCRQKKCDTGGMMSLIMLPMMAGDEVLGVLAIGSHSVSGLQQSTNFLTALSAQVSIGIYNARLSQAIKGELAESSRLAALWMQNNRILEAMQETTLELVTNLDLKSLLDNIVRRAGQLLGTDTGFLDIVDEEFLDSKPQVWQGGLSALNKFVPVYGEGVTGIVWKTGRPFVVEDYDTWEGRVVYFPKGKMKGLAGVPLKNGSRVIGILGVAYAPSSSRSFGQEELALLEQFSRLASIAIINAQLFSSRNKELLERSSAEESLRENQFWLKESQRIGKIGSYNLDIQNGTWISSDTLDVILGIDVNSEKTIEGWLELIHPDDRHTMTDYMYTEVLGLHRPFNKEYRVKHHGSGKVLWVWGQGELILDDQGNPNRMIGTIQDVNSLKAAEDQIIQLNQELEQRVLDRTLQLQAANHELEAFSYSVSHDLRALLRGIDGWSRALHDEYAGILDEKGLMYLGRVMSETQRMQLLINDMLHLSQVTGKELNLQEIDLTALSQQIANRLMDEQPGRKVVWNIQPELHLQADLPLMEIAMINLLGNALKYSQPVVEANIEVGSLMQDGRLEFFVRDNGVGFDMAYADKLFGAFQRLHSKSEFAGTGIGLATVQRIIHRHGGSIRAQSSPGSGAVFYFYM